ncbi:cupin domain-containing protein [Sorangium sp. So ce1000]|uniref:cupin domain-containing protein n=1 Tax=Sorangium sp. So ce1000 TaxID=3133325 RepID=UPI003F613F31
MNEAGIPGAPVWFHAVMRTRRGAVSVLGAIVFALLPACHAAMQPAPAATEPPATPLSQGEIRRTLVESRPATGLPGWETRLYLIEYGPGAVAPLHVHPVVGVGRVLEGSFASAFGDEPLVQVNAGQGFVDPPGVPHRVFRNVSQSQPLRFVIAYTIRAGEQIFYPGASLPAPPQ